MRVLAGTTLIAVAVSFGAGRAAVQNGAVRESRRLRVAGRTGRARHGDRPADLRRHDCRRSARFRPRRRPSLPIEPCWRYRNIAV